MRTRTVILLLAAGLAAAPGAAHAQSRSLEQTRMIDGTIGAVAGALIGGPIGLIAGAAIGYTMGPEITGPVTRPGVRYASRSARRVRRKAAPAAYQQAAQPAPYGYPVQAGPQYLAPVGYPQQAYPQQPGQVGQVSQVSQVGYAQPRPAFNPARNALVPSPDMVAPSQPYAAVATAPAPMAQPAYAYPQAGGYQIQAAPVPLPR
jgi:hypothetical protein